MCSSDTVLLGGFSDVQRTGAVDVVCHTHAIILVLIVDGS